MELLPGKVRATAPYVQVFDLGSVSESFASVPIAMASQTLATCPRLLQLDLDPADIGRNKVV